ncbi:MAG: DNA recombination protein RmuC [Gammaproteobacteria bacterium]|jgi:DNA recombination protein RmuC
MFNTIELIIIASVAVACLLVGGLIVYLQRQGKINALRETNAALTATLESERQAADARIAELEKARSKLAETFGALSNEALKANSVEFLKLAKENLKQYQMQAQNELNQKEKSFENLVKPIKETLEKTEKQIRQMEHERKEAHGALTQHLQTMMEAHQALQGETRNLVNALRRPEVRGQWGELTLKRLAELAGMVEHCDFYEQEHTTTGEGALRPDMIVRMPGGREIVVDVKTPLDAYISAVETTDETLRAQHLQRHTKNVRERVKELSSKHYWSQFKQSPDFVVLFIPGEQFLSSALDNDAGLMEFAMKQKVILATPTSMVALMRAIAYGWRQESLAENAVHIREIGSELYQRLATFTDHLSKMGKSLTSSVQHFNKAVGSMDTRILPSAKKFTEMGIHADKPVEQVSQIETTPRSVESNSEQDTKQKQKKADPVV